MFNLQKSFPTNDPEVVNYIDINTDPDIDGTVFNTPYSTTQIVPEPGIDLGIVLFRHIDLGVSLSYAIGHRSYQDLTFEYTYQGVPQPTAKWYADGSAWFATFGVGIKFW